MSTFNGKLEEIPEISVDRFDNENDKSLIYFLSHCHTDHMVGLSDWAFHSSLVQRPDVYLYASPISVAILKNLYPQIESKLKPLAMDSPTLIKIPYRDDKSITVTPVPAGHCPGSVMFLFESDKTVLYTGDYRVRASDLQKYQAFYSLDQLKKIDKLYLDTTFFSLSFLKLPSRQQSLEEICKAIKDWIEQSKKHVIQIFTSATYGSEFLFAEIANKIGMPIHVNSKAYQFYKCIPEMSNAVTTNYKLTQIHSGCGSTFRSVCEMEKNNSLTRVIKPSVLWWKDYDFSRGITSVTNNQEYRICYSCHASLEEIEDFLMFLKPVEIEPCVVPNNEKEKENMFKLLNKVMKIYQDQPPEEEAKVRLFQINTARSEEVLNEPLTPEENSSSHELDDILQSPPKKFKRMRLWTKSDYKNQ